MMRRINIRPEIRPIARGNAGEPIEAGVSEAFIRPTESQEPYQAMVAELLKRVSKLEHLEIVAIHLHIPTDG